MWKKKKGKKNVREHHFQSSNKRKEDAQIQYGLNIVSIGLISAKLDRHKNEEKKII